MNRTDTLYVELLDIPYKNTSGGRVRRLYSQEYISGLSERGIKTARALEDGMSQYYTNFESYIYCREKKEFLPCQFHANVLHRPRSTLLKFVGTLKDTSATYYRKYSLENFIRYYNLLSPSPNINDYITNTIRCDILNYVFISSEEKVSYYTVPRNYILSELNITDDTADEDYILNTYFNNPYVMADTYKSWQALIIQRTKVYNKILNNLQFPILKTDPTSNSSLPKIPPFKELLSGTPTRDAYHFPKIQEDIPNFQGRVWIKVPNPNDPNVKRVGNTLVTRVQDNKIISIVPIQLNSSYVSSHFKDIYNSLRGKKVLPLTFIKGQRYEEEARYAF